jgi:mannose/fructose-specific phosphotransferase system component IIA
MSEPLRGVVVSHAGLAEALLDALVHITGQSDGIVAVTNDGCDREALERRVDQAVGDAPAVVFVDLPSGSCLLASARYLRTHERVAVVAGVNLPMLVDFVYHRDAAPEAAAARAVEVGTRAVKVVAT